MDLDFGYLVAIAKQKMPTVILFRLQNETSENVNRHLNQVLSRLGNEVLGGNIVVSVNENKIRVRRLS